MIITLTTKTSYDLNDDRRFNCFRNNVNRMINKGNRNTELDDILKQLIKQNSNQAPALKEKINTVINKIRVYLEAVENKHSAADKDSKGREVPLKSDKTKIGQWEKTGEHSFQRMYVRLIEDAHSSFMDTDINSAIRIRPVYNFSDPPTLR